MHPFWPPRTPPYRRIPLLTGPAGCRLRTSMHTAHPLPEPYKKRRGQVLKRRGQVLQSNTRPARPPALLRDHPKTGPKVLSPRQPIGPKVSPPTSTRMSVQSRTPLYANLRTRPAAAPSKDAPAEPPSPSTRTIAEAPPSAEWLADSVFRDPARNPPARLAGARGEGPAGYALSDILAEPDAEDLH